MTLVMRDSKLLIGSDGKLTINQDCCCGGLLPCECKNTSEGSAETAKVVVTLSGSPICYKPFSIISGTCNGTSFSGYDWSGSYAVACSSASNWFASTYACSVAGTQNKDYYVIEKLSIQFDTPASASDLYVVTVAFRSYKYIDDYPGTNPCPGLATSCAEATEDNLSFQNILTYESDGSLVGSYRACSSTMSLESSGGIPYDAPYCDTDEMIISSVVTTNV